MSFKIGKLYEWRPLDRMYEDHIFSVFTTHNDIYNFLAVEFILNVKAVVVMLECHSNNNKSLYGGTDTIDIKILSTEGQVGWTRVSEKNRSEWVCVS